MFIIVTGLSIEEPTLNRTTAKEGYSCSYSLGPTLPKLGLLRRVNYPYNRLTKRAYRNRPLSEKDKQFNRLLSGVRCTVECIFGVLKQHYGMVKVRYLGLARNRIRFELMCVAHNMKRGLSLQQASCV